MIAWVAVGSIATVLAVVPTYAKPLGRWIILFPQRRAERLLGQCFIGIVQSIGSSKSASSSTVVDGFDYRA